MRKTKSLQSIKTGVALAIIALATIFAARADAMDAVDVTLVRHASNRYWVLQSADAQMPDGYLIGANEQITDQIEALDTKTSLQCKMKYRRVLVYNAPGLQTIMVYGLSGCHS